MEFSVLFVDDEPQILTTLAAAFSKQYKVFTASGGKDAIEIVRKFKIHVLVSDQRMPEMTGIQLLQQVKGISPSTMRILLTGYADLDAIIGAVNVGDVFRFVNKPWKNDKLRETISLACEISDKTLKVSAETQLIQTAEHNDLFKDYHVLFVDSNPVHLAAFKEMFSAEYSLHLAATAEEAFGIIRMTKVTVLIIDSTIKSNNGMIDGADFLNAVKSDYPELITIYLGDSQDATMAIRLINEGQLFRYLIKPFKRESLKLTLKEAVKRYDSVSNKTVAKTSIFWTDEKPKPVTPANSIFDAITAARERLKARSTY